MWDWFKSVGNGIVNIFSGKTWSGEDPDAIKASAELALKEKDDALTAVVSASNSTNRTLLVFGGVALVGGLIYMVSRPRYGRR